MRYIKSYESYQEEYKFKIGDCVFVTYNGCKDDIYKIEDNRNHNDNDIFRLREVQYLLKNIEDEKDSAWIPEYDIMRVATPHEIEIIKLKKPASKYNL